MIHSRSGSPVAVVAGLTARRRSAALATDSFRNADMRSLNNSASKSLAQLRKRSFSSTSQFTSVCHAFMHGATLQAGPGQVNAIDS